MTEGLPDDLSYALYYIRCVLKLQPDPLGSEALRLFDKIEEALK